MATTSAIAAPSTSCHRCGNDLPALAGELVLFCPYCGAPQLRLPDHLRAVSPEAEAAEARTTGTLPPPRPHAVDWQAAMRCAALVALLGSLLGLFAMVSPVAGGLSRLWALGSGAFALMLYARLRPGARLNARVGARLGLTTGLFTVALTGLLLGLAAVTARLGHRAPPAQDAQAEQILHNFGTQPVDPAMRETRDHWVGILASPEGRGGLELVGLGLDAVFLMLLGTAGGAVAGMATTRPQRMGGLA